MRHGHDAVIITGSEGGIGQALCAAFRAAGSHVVGTDLRGKGTGVDAFVEADLAKLCSSAAYRGAVTGKLRSGLGKRQLKCLVNNAAVQIVKSTGELTSADWERTLNVNVLAPFLLAQAFLPELEDGGGSVVNVASIHAKATKPGFVAYATSKAALVGLTAAMAVDLGRRVRVNAICPAAVSTSMLEAGFSGNPAQLKRLGEMHPIGRIVRTEEVAQLVAYLASRDAAGITGAAWYIDGGIGVRLHEPM